MTSRRYSELNKLSNMTINEEGDENAAPADDANSTPRAKMVPMKKTRISDSPLSSFRQQDSAFNGDNNLEENFVEQSFVAAPSNEEDPSLKSIERCVPFAVDKSLEETFGEPSFLAAPVTTTHQASLTEYTPQPVSFANDKHLEQTFVEQSFAAAPSNEETPLTEYTPQPVSFANDKHLEQTFAEHSFAAAPSNEETPLTEYTPQPVSFANDKHLEQTFVEQSFAAAPSNEETPLSETFVEQSFVDGPLSAAPCNSSLESTKRGVTFANDKHLEQIFVVHAFCASPSNEESSLTESSPQPVPIANDKHLEKTRVEPSCFGASSSKPVESMENDNDMSFVGASQISFMETEMQIYAEEECKCSRFESVMKEYTILREKFDAKTANAVRSANSTLDEFGSFKDDEMLKLTYELVKARNEIEDYKKSAVIAKKEAEDFQFILEEEKRRTNNRISDLQKENFALHDKLEKLGGGDNVAQQNGNAVKEQIAHLKEQVANALAEAEEYKRKVQLAEKEAKNLQAALTEERNAFTSRLSDFSLQRDAEMDALKASLGDSAALKDELLQLKEKLQIFDSVVQRGFEVETECNKLKVELKEIASEHAYCAQAKEKMFKENARLEEQLSQLSNQLATAKSDVEFHRGTNVQFRNACKAAEEGMKHFKLKAESAQKEVDNLQKLLAEAEDLQAALTEEKNAFTSRLSDFSLQRDAEMDALKASLGDSAALKDELLQLKEKLQMFDSVVQRGFEVETECNKLKGELKEIASEHAYCAQAKEKMFKENARLEEQLSQLSNQLATAKSDVEFHRGTNVEFRNACEAAEEEMKHFKLKAESAQKEVDNLQKLLAEAEDLQAALTEERNAFTSRLSDFSLQRDAEMDALKASLGDSAAMKDELLQLKEKLQMFDSVVQRGFEVETECKKLKGELKEIASEHAYCAQAKEKMFKENARLEEQLSQLSNQLATAKSDVEFHRGTNVEFRNACKAAEEEMKHFKLKAESAQKEVNNLQKLLAEAQPQNDAQLESIKAEMKLLEKENADLNDKFGTKVAEWDLVKDAYEKERTKLQEELAKEGEKVKELDKKIGKLYDDLDVSDAERKELSEVVFDLQSKLSKYTGGEDGYIVRAAINMADAISPTIHDASPDDSFSSFKTVDDEAEQVKPSSSAAQDATPTQTTPMKQSFGSKLASPFRRQKSDQAQTSSGTAPAAAKDSSCVTQ